MNNLSEELLETNPFERLLKELVENPETKYSWFNKEKNLFSYHFKGKRGLAIKRPKQETIINLPLGIFLLCNNSNYTPEILGDTKNEFICLEYSDKTMVDENIAQAILMDFCLKRAEIMKDPRKWYNGWATMIGNSLAEVKPYPVLAELLMLKKLCDNDLITNIKDEWTGPNKQLHDFELQTPSVSIEVKSTTIRSRSEITISSAYQLNPTEDKPLYLVFFIFQAASPNDCAGWTLEKLVQSFKNIENFANEKIKEGGLGWNDKAATVVECRYYRVDDNFPKITLENFKDRKFPKDITKIIYNVNLDGATQITEKQFFQELKDIKEGKLPCVMEIPVEESVTDVKESPDITQIQPPVPSDNIPTETPALTEPDEEMMPSEFKKTPEDVRLADLESSQDFISKFTSRSCEWLDFDYNEEKIHLDGTRFSDIVQKVAEFVWTKNPEKVKDSMGKQNYKNIANAESTFGRDPEKSVIVKIDDGCFINTKLSAGDSARFIKNMLKLCKEVKLESAVIHLNGKYWHVKKK